MDLSERKLKILQAIVGDYIRSAEPVGSRTLSKKYDMGISAATIRNEMSDLEEMGLLTHPHTSAGRVPSDKDTNCRRAKKRSSMTGFLPASPNSTGHCSGRRRSCQN